MLKFALFGRVHMKFLLIPFGRKGLRKVLRGAGGLPRSGFVQQFAVHGPNYAPQACGLLRKLTTSQLCSVGPVSKALAGNFGNENEFWKSR